MNVRLPRLTAKETIKIIEKLGFTLILFKKENLFDDKVDRSDTDYGCYADEQSQPNCGFER
jgi:hypothetical protein